MRIDSPLLALLLVIFLLPGTTMADMEYVLESILGPAAGPGPEGQQLVEKRTELIKTEIERLKLEPEYVKVETRLFKTKELASQQEKEITDTYGEEYKLGLMDGLVDGSVWGTFNTLLILAVNDGFLDNTSYQNALAAGQDIWKKNPSALAELNSILLYYLTKVRQQRPMEAKPVTKEKGAAKDPGVGVKTGSSLTKTKPVIKLNPDGWYATKNSRVFHRGDCHLLEKSGDLMTFLSYQQAVQVGGTPCGVCSRESK